MPNYQKAKIYKIIDVNEEMVYVGCTINTLARRMAHHRACYNMKDFTTSHIIFDKYGVENCKILLLENYPCNNKEELLKREGEYIKQTLCVNKVISGRTREEYYQDNKEELAKTKKLWVEDNKLHVAEYNKTYNQNNKDTKQEYNKIYREKNKELLKEKRKEKRKEKGIS